MFHNVAGKRVTVMGLGRFGGGVGAIQFLASRGARVTVTDLAGEEALADSLAQIADLPLERVRLGGHDASDFLNADLIVASPAVPVDAPLLAAAEAAGIPVTTEVGLFWSLCRGKIIGVTGSVGKSTTSAMIHAVLSAAGRRAWFGGNIGVSLLSDVDRITPDDWVVLELSSFQLERIAPLKPRPRIAVVTNFRPNHLDRHGTLDDYRAAKQNLLRWQTAKDIAVLNADDSDVSCWFSMADRWRFGSRGETHPDFGDATLGAFFDDSEIELRLNNSSAVLPLSLTIPGRHHRRNAAAAAATAAAIGIEPSLIVAALAAFRGLPHRLEVLGEFDGRLWVNDSKATTPESAIAALQAFDRPVRLIAGGADKGVDLTQLVEAIVRQDVAVFLSGATGPRVAALLADRGHRAFTLCESFDASVLTAKQKSLPGDVILLSPACASWGQFRDYRERGERFTCLAESLADC